MARILRIHLAGVGHQEARFHPLSLRFDRNSAGMDAVVNLRNGGGKTSLLSLIYAVLLPGKTDFLGRVNGSQRTIDEYFSLGRLGVVALEMESQVARFGLLLAWVRRERDEPPSLFSFKTGSDGIPFDDLPLQGLAKAPVSTLADLTNWLAGQNALRPAMIDLYPAPNFREWHTHLRKSRGVDPHLYRTHLQMNRTEGAVDEEFKFSKTEQFIRRYLDFAMEAPTMGRDAEDPITASLAEHRLSLTKEPHYRKELEFISEILPYLRELDGHTNRKQSAERDRAAAFSELGLLADGIAFLAEKYRGLEKEHDARHGAEKARRDELIRLRDKARRHATGYDRRSKELRILEAERALADAKRKEAETSADARQHSAALSWRTVRETRSQLRALDGQRVQLQQQLRPERDEVERRARRLDAAFQDAIAGAQLLLEKAQKQEQDVQSEILSQRKALAKLTAAHSVINGELTDKKGKIELANRAREPLVSAGIIRPREEAKTAQERLSNEAFSLRNRGKILRGESKEARRTAKERRTKASAFTKAANDASKLAERASDELRRFQAACDLCAGLDRVQQVLEGGKFDPFNAGVVGALRGRERGLRGEITELEIARAEDRRVTERFDPQQNPLFPAPLEVEGLLQQLRLRGVRAFTAFEWLGVNTSADKARALMHADPATFGGLVVNTKDEMEAAKACARAGLSRPIRISLSSDLDRRAEPLGHTILPERAGLFNPTEAQAEIGSIREAQKIIEARAAQLTTDADEFATAAERVAQLQNDFTPAWFAQTSETQRANESLARQESDAAARELAAAEVDDEAATRAESEAAECDTRASTVEGQHGQVTSYIVNFQNHLEGWLKAQRELTDSLDANQARQDEIAVAIERMDLELPTLAENKRRADLQLLDLGHRRIAAKLGAYVTEATGSVAHGDIAEEEAGFTAAREVYEEKARNDVLDAQIKRAQMSVDEAETAFNKLAVKSSDVAELSATPDLELQANLAFEAERQAKTDVVVALGDLQRVSADKPKPLGVNERADLDPDLPEPATSKEAEERKKEKGAEAESFHTQAEELREVVADLERQTREAAGAAKDYEIMSMIALPARSEAPRESAHLTGSPDGDRARIQSVKDRFEEARALVGELSAKIASVMENRIDPLLKHEKWDAFAVDIRVKLRRMNRTVFEGNANQSIRECEERQAGIEDKLKEIDELRGTLVDKLYARASDALALLEHAQRLSRIPPGVGAWSDQQFIKVHVPPRGTVAERRVGLTKLLDSWMAPTKRDVLIPSGAALAYDCLMAVLNQKEIGIEILKPEASNPEALNYQPITKLASFSGGQRVTAAILLYCVIVRVRSDHGDLITDCGFLMLDNPFGKASHFPLVDLQLKMAAVMGVQLVYLTGINDFEALSVFPLRIRLRNSARNSASGERLVQHEANAVEAVRLGVSK